MTTEQPTLQQTIQTTAAYHDVISAEIKTPEIRVYETKTSRILATGEIREYTTKQHYVGKKNKVYAKQNLKGKNRNFALRLLFIFGHLRFPI